jgi:hypothetical protein
MGFGAMAADEYILIVPFAAQHLFRPDSYFDAFNNNQLSYLYHITLRADESRNTATDAKP